MLRKKIMVALLVFILLFSGVWYMHEHMDRKSPDRMIQPPTDSEDYQNQQLKIEQQMEIEQQHLPIEPFGPREYIRIR